MCPIKAALGCTRLSLPLLDGAELLFPSFSWSPQINSGLGPICRDSPKGKGLLLGRKRGWRDAVGVEWGLDYPAGIWFLQDSMELPPLDPSSPQGELTSG